MQTKVVQNIKTHIQNLFLKSFHYEIMWKYMVQPDRPQIIYDGACALHSG